MPRQWMQSATGMACPITFVDDGNAAIVTLAIQLSGLDVEEVLGLTDCGLLVRGLEALGVGLALEETANLPISAGIG